MLHTTWRPSLSDEALKILGRTDSLLEQAFFFGAWHFLETKSKDGEGPDRLTLKTSRVKFGNDTYEGLWLVEPWFGWYQSGTQWGGPSALMFVPQLKAEGKDITHDFGLFYGDDNGSPKWNLRSVVEVDGYGVHKDRRPEDAMRDEGLTYPVMRLYEETDKPLTWFEKVVAADAAARKSA
jgi:hypothetical protein